MLNGAVSSAFDCVAPISFIEVSVIMWVRRAIVVCGELLRDILEIFVGDALSH